MNQKLLIEGKKGVLPRFMSSMNLMRLVGKHHTTIRRYRERFGYRTMNIVAIDPETGEQFELGTAGLYPAPETEK